MFAIESLLKHLEKAPLVEKDRTDPRFFEVLSFVEKARFLEAKVLIEDLFNEGLFDIRLIMYFLFGDILENGIKGIKKIFNMIPHILKENWNHLYPLRNRETQCKSSLKWFFDSTVKMLKRSEEKIKEGMPNEFWEKSLKEVSIEDIDKTITACSKVDVFLTEEWPHFDMNSDQLSYLIRWLKEFKMVIRQNHEEPKEIEILEKEQVEEEIVLEKEDSTKQEVPERPPSLKQNKQEIQQKQDPWDSSPMQLFFQKLETFKKLIQEEEFLKAAIVANDISQCIQDFDPTKYFPMIFSQFFALQAKHTEVLSENWKNKESFVWKALTQLYHVDLNGFADW